MTTTTRTPTLLALALFALAPAAPAFAQTEPPPDDDPAAFEDPAAAAGPGVAWRLGLRLGAFDMINSSDSYDAVYGEPMPQLGIALEAQVRRWLIGLTWDHGEVDGEQVLPSRPPRSTGVGETLTYRPLSLTAAWVINPEARWRWHVGAGATLLDWEDEGASRSADGSDTGGHVVGGVRRDRRGWTFGGELRWSTIPDAVGEAGITRFFGDDDLGGVALHVVALYRIR